MHAGHERVDGYRDEPVDREHRRVVADAEHDVAVVGSAREIARDDLELADQGALFGVAVAAAARSSRAVLSSIAFTNL